MGDPKGEGLVNDPHSGVDGIKGSIGFIKNHKCDAMTFLSEQTSSIYDSPLDPTGQVES